MPDDIAELPPPGAKHAEAPGWFGREVHDVAKGQLRRRGQPVADILVALAHDLKVEGDHQRRAVRRLGTLDKVTDEVAVTHHIELEPERLAGIGGHILDRADRHGGQGEGNAKRLGRLRGEDFTISMLHAGQAGRGERHRHRHVLSEHLHGGAALRYIDGNALAELDGLQVGLVRLEGRLGPGPALAIIVEHARHAPLHLFAQIFNAGDNTHRVTSLSDTCFRKHRKFRPPINHAGWRQSTPRAATSGSSGSPESARP